MRGRRSGGSIPRPRTDSDHVPALISSGRLHVEHDVVSVPGDGFDTHVPGVTRYWLDGREITHQQYEALSKSYPPRCLVRTQDESHTFTDAELAWIVAHMRPLGGRFWAASTATAPRPSWWRRVLRRRSS